MFRQNFEILITLQYSISKEMMWNTEFVHLAISDIGIVEIYAVCQKPFDHFHKFWTLIGTLETAEMKN